MMKVFQRTIRKYSQPRWCFFPFFFFCSTDSKTKSRESDMRNTHGWRSLALTMTGARSKGHASLLQFYKATPSIKPYSLTTQWKISVTLGFPLKYVHNQNKLFAVHQRLFSHKPAVLQKKKKTRWDLQCICIMSGRYKQTNKCHNVRREINYRKQQ